MGDGSFWWWAPDYYNNQSAIAIAVCGFQQLHIEKNMLNTTMLVDVASSMLQQFGLDLHWPPGMKPNNITDIPVSNIVTEAKH